MKTGDLSPPFVPSVFSRGLDCFRRAALLLAAALGLTVTHAQSLPSITDTLRSSNGLRLDGRGDLSDGSGLAAPATTAKPRAEFFQIPLSFEVNEGQTDATVRYLSRGPGYSVFLTPKETALALRKPEIRNANSETNAKSEIANLISESAPRLLRLKLLNAHPNPRITGIDPLPGKANYFLGNDPALWRTNVPTFAKVKYEQVYPGVDMAFYGNQRQVEFDFIVAPGADPRQIAMTFEGADNLEVNSSGDVSLRIRDGEVRLIKPVVYQMVNRVKRPVDGRYLVERENVRARSSRRKEALISNSALENPPARVTFHVPSYDPAHPLIVDPVFVYSIFSALRPAGMLEFGKIPLPILDPGGTDANARSHALGLTVKTRMLQKPPEVHGSIVCRHIQPDEAISGMTQPGFKEAPILCKQSDASDFVQNRDDIRVFGAQARDFSANPSKWNPPFHQERFLVLRKVLVQEVQATTRSGSLCAVRRARESFGSSQTSFASRTASATAASGTRPPHRTLQMKSQDRPSATSSNTCQTIMRVPLNVGWPWQISGSATMYRPNSTLATAFLALPRLPFFMLAIYGAVHRLARRLFCNLRPIRLAPSRLSRKDAEIPKAKKEFLPAFARFVFSCSLNGLRRAALTLATAIAPMKTESVTASNPKCKVPFRWLGRRGCPHAAPLHKPAPREPKLSIIVGTDPFACGVARARCSKQKVPIIGTDPFTNLPLSLCSLRSLGPSPAEGVATKSTENTKNHEILNPESCIVDFSAAPYDSPHPVRIDPVNPTDPA
jgi:hypothetical protein